MLKRITTIIISAAMILSGVFMLPPKSHAADVGGDLNAVKSAGYTYYGNLLDVSVYNDELFTRDSRTFDTAGSDINESVPSFSQQFRAQ